MVLGDALMGVDIRSQPVCQQTVSGAANISGSAIVRSSGPVSRWLEITIP